MGRSARSYVFFKKKKILPKFFFSFPLSKNAWTKGVYSIKNVKSLSSFTQHTHMHAANLLLYNKSTDSNKTLLSASKRSPHSSSRQLISILNPLLRFGFNYFHFIVFRSACRIISLFINAVFSVHTRVVRCVLWVRVWHQINFAQIDVCVLRMLYAKQWAWNYFLSKLGFPEYELYINIIWSLSCPYSWCHNIYWNSSLELDSPPQSYASGCV